MSALDTDTSRPTAEQPAAPAVQSPPRACPRCGAPLQPEQDWCLSCGAAASTRIAPAPSWRAPLAIVATVLVMAAAGIAVAFLSLTDDAERVAQAPEPTATASPAPTESPVATDTPQGAPTPTPTPEGTATADPSITPTPTATGPATVGTWPEGEEAWTIILLSTEDEDGARARADEVAAGGTPVGVLNSSDFSSLRPGYWVVFSGQYETSEEAQAAAAGLGAAAAGSYARLVKP